MCGAWGPAAGTPAGVLFTLEAESSKSRRKPKAEPVEQPFWVVGLNKAMANANPNVPQV